MKIHRYRLLCLPLLAVAAVGGAALRQARAPIGPAAPAASAPRASATTAPAPAPRAPAAEVRTYTVTLSQEVTMDGSVFARTRLQGRLSLLPIPGTSLTEARIDEPSLEMSGQEPPTTADLCRPILLARDAEGRLQGVRFDPETQEPARLLLTALVTSAHYTDGTGPRWSTDEDDGSGMYRAEYVRDGADAVRRHKRGYARRLEGLTPVSAEGDARFVLDGRGGILSLDAREASRARASAVFGAIDGALSVSLRLADRAPATAFDLAAARARASRYEAPQMAMPRGGQDAMARRMDERRAAGRSLDELRRSFAETDGLARAGGAGQRRAELINTAGALFRARPEEAVAAGRQLADSGLTGAAANFLAGGLAAAGTDVAAHALADALASPSATAEARRQAAVSLALMPVADASTIDALSQGAASDDPALVNMSSMALGAAARALTASGGDGTLDPVAPLLERYAAAADDGTRIMLLAALGNSGDARALDVIRAALDSPALAPTAAYALRFVPGSAVDDLLHAIVTRSPSPDLRQAAYRAVPYRAADPWAQWLQSQAQQETDPRTLASIRAALAQLST